MNQASSHSVVLNGKFLAGPATGVQRVAAEMIKALDRLLQNSGTIPGVDRIELMTPRLDVAQLGLRSIPTSTAGFFKGIPWEQLDLPRLAYGRLLINLANLGPVLAPNAITMIHDLQTYSSPESYSPQFRAWYHTVQPILGKRNHRILTVSEFSKQQIIKYGVARADRIDVIHNGVDHIAGITPCPRAMARFELTPVRFVLGLANTQSHKNIDVLLRAFDDERLSAIDLVLFGSANRAALEKQHGRQLPSNVKVIGKISDEELRALLESALCLAFPSKTEGFGLPPLEAMFVGCPAIVAPCGALPEVCGDAAVFADPDDAGAWVAAIKALADSPAEWETRSQQARLHASAFRWERSALQLMDIVRKCL